MFASPTVGRNKYRTTQTKEVGNLKASFAVTSKRRRTKTICAQTTRNCHMIENPCSLPICALRLRRLTSGSVRTVVLPPVINIISELALRPERSYQASRWQYNKQRRPCPRLYCRFLFLVSGDWEIWDEFSCRGLASQTMTRLLCPCMLSFKST